jgi:glycine/D-amino acid oxidase-like deaminating enzyme
MEPRADVVIIGGGIIGCATAYYLARRGVDTVLLEKDDIAWEQSKRAWGFVRQQRRDPAELPLMTACNKMWPQLSAELEADFEWAQAGIMAVAHTEERMAYYRDWYEMSRDYDVESRLLTPADIREIVPDMRGNFVGGIYTPSDGHAEPGPATKAFANAAEGHGARILTRHTVTGIDVTNGRVTGVRTNRGDVKANAVVCAAGIWSGRLARMVGLTLPLLAISQSVGETEPLPDITRTATWTPGVAFRQRPGGTVYFARPDDGDYSINLDSLRFARQFLPNFMANRSAFRLHVGRDLIKDAIRHIPIGDRWSEQFEEGVSVEPAPNPDVVERARVNLEQLFPHLEGIRLKRSWGGVIDATPDAIPVIGEARDLPGFVFATGFSGHGLGIGPIAGKLIAELIDKGTTSLDISAFRFERFEEARKIETTKIA